MKLFMLFSELNFSPLPQVKNTSGTEPLQTALAIIFGIFGAVAVLIITIAGLQYVLSQGDPQKTAKAKDTILYAVIGLVLSLSAYFIVTFVVSRL